MKKIAIYYNKEKEKAVKACEELCEWLTSNNYNFFLEELASKNKNKLAEANYIIALGGDGTMLRAARLACKYDKPILGVFLGTLGFLAEIDKDSMYNSILKISSSNYHIDSRSMLKMSILRNGKAIHSGNALNEIVVSSSKTRMLNINVEVAENYVTTYSADGLIISTPTGSTAYNLSSGGPILSPDLNLAILTPICAHSLNLRSLVIDAEKEIIISPSDPSHFKNAFISLDGQQEFSLTEKDKVIINKSEHQVKFIRFKDEYFYDALRSKLKWSGKSC